MNKFLLITGLGTLFFTVAFSQAKITYNIPRFVTMPVPVLAKSGNASKLRIDDHLLNNGEKLAGLYPNGDTIFIGTQKQNSLQGNWKSFYQSGQLLDSGRLKHGVPDGVWKTFHADGSLRSLRSFDAEKLAYVQNEIRRKEARSTFFVITDIAKKDMAAANHLMTASYSYNTSGNKDAQLNSLEKRVLHNASQPIYYPPFDECLHHGLYMNFFSDGKAKDSGYYKNGVRDGLWKERNEEGSILATGIYKRGRPHADWRFFNKEGRLIYIQHYNENGKLKQTINLKN